MVSASQRGDGMAKKAKTVFVCQECGSESTKWTGQCPVCHAWNSLVEEKVIEFDQEDKRRRISSRSSGAAAGRAGGRATGTVVNKPAKLSGIASGETTRIDTGIKELNRVLGGGLVPGSLTLISGEPGIGKSTIILQAAQNIAETKGRVLYVCGGPGRRPPRPAGVPGGERAADPRHDPAAPRQVRPRPAGAPGLGAPRIAGAPGKFVDRKSVV